MALYQVVRTRRGGPQEPQQQQEVGEEAMRKEDHNVEDPRPARRRKLRLVSTEALPAMQLEIDKYHL